MMRITAAGAINLPKNISTAVLRGGTAYVKLAVSGAVTSSTTNDRAPGKAAIRYEIYRHTH